MWRNEKQHRNTALFLCALVICNLIFAMVSGIAFSVSANGDDGLCAHHPQHTAACGYGDPCTYVCKTCDRTIASWAWEDPEEVLLRGKDYGISDAEWVLGIGDVKYLPYVLPTKIDAVTKRGEKVSLDVTWDLDHPHIYRKIETLSAKAQKIDYVDEELPEEILSLSALAFEQALEENQGEEAALAAIADEQGSAGVTAVEQEGPPYHYIYAAILPDGYTLEASAPALEVLVRTESIVPFANIGDQAYAWRLVHSNGTSYEIYLDGSPTNDTGFLELPARKLADGELTAFANEIRDQYTFGIKTYWQGNNNEFPGNVGGWSVFGVRSATYDAEKTNEVRNTIGSTVWMFEVLPNTDDTVNWAKDKWQNGPDGVAHFYVMVRDPDDLPQESGINAWRMVAKGTNDVVDDIRTSSDNAIALPDQVAETALETWGDTLMALYDFQARETQNSAFMTYEIASVTYLGAESNNTIARYRLNVKTTFYWPWNNGTLATFEVTVGITQDGKSQLVKPGNEGGDSGNMDIEPEERGAERWILWPEVVDADFDPAVFAARFGANAEYDRISIVTGGAWKDYAISSLQLDTARTEDGDREIYLFQVVFTGEAPANAYYIFLYKPLSAAISDVTNWRGTGDRGTTPESGYQNDMIEFEVDDNDYTSQAFAEVLKERYPYLELYRSSIEAWEKYPVESVTYLEQESNEASTEESKVGIYEIKLAEDYRWSDGTPITFKFKATQQALVHDHVHAWRIVNKETGTTLYGPYYNESGLPDLPDEVARSLIGRYGSTLKEKYGLEVDYQSAQGVWEPVVIKSYDFTEYRGNLAIYRINTRDTYYWDWGTLFEVFVTVHLGADGSTEFVLKENAPGDQGNIVVDPEEHDGDEIWYVWPEDTPESFDPEEFASRFGLTNSINRLGLLQGGEWQEYWIDRITYEPARAPDGLREAWLFSITFYEGNQPDQEFTYYIVVYGFFDESPYIVTDRVVDQANVKVNFFDYWLTDQYRNDYRVFADNLEEAVLSMGINQGHLFIFAGGQAFGSQIPGGFVDRYGRWNVWTGNDQYGPKWHTENDRQEAGNWNWNMRTPNGNFKPQQGIVDQTMGADGYPHLALGDSAWFRDGWESADNYNKSTSGNPAIDYGNVSPGKGDFVNWLGDLMEDSNKTSESLAYLFNPALTHEGKASYEDVSGLFRVNTQGYYYFDSNDTFAELNIENGNNKENREGNHVTLYNTVWRLMNANGTAGGQFFPFNNWSNLFEPVPEEEGGGIRQINQDTGGGEGRTALWNQSLTDDPINHYFGMTMEAVFQQPQDGQLRNGDHVIFEFSGDDDVWIFIDGVLVADLGGIHDAVHVTIDFATGEINYNALGVAETTETGDLFRTSNLYTAFTDAKRVGSVSWNSDNTTFRDDSVHTLTFYYLERGNDVSNCSIRYNLQPIFADRIRKVDEAGGVIEGVGFAVYEARPKATVWKDESAGETKENYVSGYNPFAAWHTADEFERIGSVIATSTTRADGNADFLDDQGNPITLDEYEYLILEETNPPEGYRKNPDIVLQIFKGKNNMVNTFMVVNKYETGAYASYMTEWVHAGEIHFANYNARTSLDRGHFTKSTQKADVEALQNGLAIVVPAIKLVNENGEFRRWLPMWGSNTYGWKTIYENSYQNGGNKENDTRVFTQEFIRDLIMAAFLQVADEDGVQDWYVSYNGNGMETHMENLPGDASRYVTANDEWEDADLKLVTLFIPEEALKALGIDTTSDQDMYNALKIALDDRLGDVSEASVRAFLDAFLAENPDLAPATEAASNANNEQFSMLYTDDWDRTYHTVVYIPNEQRELRVRKMDTFGNYVDGAVFAIFNTAKDAYDYLKAHEDTTRFESTNEAMASLEAGMEAGTISGLLSFGATGTVELDTSVDGTQDGLLIFQERKDNKDSEGEYRNGYAKIDWPEEYRDSDDDAEDSVFWLVEIFAPHGLALNENMVRIEAGDLSIYANATGYRYVPGQDGQPGHAEQLTDDNLESLDKTNDGIKVRAALGRLDQTLIKYAVGNNVNVTLQDIVIRKQTQEGDKKKYGALISKGWQESTGDVKGEDYFNLHYGVNAEELTGQYGRHSGDSDPPIFEVEDGYVRVIPRQNLKLDEYADLKGFDGHDSTARRDILTDNNQVDGKLMDLDPLFGLMNIVVIEDRLLPLSLELSKLVEGVPDDADYFEYSLTLWEEYHKYDVDPETGDLTDTGVQGKVELDQIYHAYLHDATHYVYDADGTRRACAPADHLEDHDDLLLIPYKETGNAEQDAKYKGSYQVYIIDRDENGDIPKNEDGTVNIPWNEDGTLNTSAHVHPIYLKPHQALVIVDLPDNTEFEITERIIYSPEDVGYGDPDIEVADGWKKSDEIVRTAKGSIVNGQLYPEHLYEDTYYDYIGQATVKYTNYALRGGLSVEKRVEGDASDTDEFEFTITMTRSEDREFNMEDLPLYKTKAGDGTDVPMTITWSLSEDKKTLTGTFNLRKDWKVTIYPLEPGISYQVTETNAGENYRQVSATGEIGVTEDERLSEVVFVNARNLVGLPGMGGMGTWVYYVNGMLLALAGVEILYIQYKKRYEYIFVEP